jgi:hypothetical protein
MIPDWIKKLRAKAGAWLAKKREARGIARIKRKLNEQDYWREPQLDKDENASTQPPTDESINIWCLWVVEFYGLSQFQSLLNGLKSLGLADRKHEREQSPIEFMQKVRQRSYTGSWLRLGSIHKRDEQQWSDALGGGIRADLPRGVDVANGTVLQVLPSVVAVTMQFVFDDDTTTCLQEILQETPATQTLPMETGHGRLIILPTAQKRDRIAQARASLRSRCEFWFGQYLRGVFSASPFPVRFPACEFVTFSKGAPFSDTVERNRYIEVLGLDRTWEGWKCEQIPGLKLGWRGQQQTGSDYLMLAANEADVAKSAKEHQYIETPRFFAMSRLADFDRWLVGWSLRGLLEHYSQSLLELRDKALRDVTAPRFSRALRKTQRELLRLRPDVVAFAGDVNDMGRSGDLVRMSDYKFEALDTRSSNRELLELVLQRVHEESERLNRNIRSVTDDFMTSVEVRHQSALTWYTAAIFAFTVVLVILTGFLIYLELTRSHT